MSATAGRGAAFRGGHAQQYAKAREKSRLGKPHDPEKWTWFSGWIMRLERLAMVEKSIMSSRNVIDLSRYRERNAATRAPALSPRLCRHCGAALLEGEREEECSSAFNADALRLRWQAAQILRGLI
jgi:hypothetical protein